MAIISRKGVSRFLTSLAERISGNPVISNAFAKAFYNLIGQSYTRYDPQGPTYVEKGYNQNPVVYAVIQQMATKTADVPFEVKRVKKEDASRKLYKKTRHDFAKTPAAFLDYIRTKSEAFEEEVLEMPLERPNPRETWEEFIALYKTFIRLTGNAYLYFVAPQDGKNAGQPSEMYLLPSHLINIVIKKDADVLEDEDPVDHYLLIEGEQYVEFPSQNVVHIKLPNPNYDYNGRHLYGQSPIAAALKNVQSSNAGHDNNIKTMANGGSFGIIYGDGPEPLSDGDAQQLKARLKEMDNDKGRLSNYAGIGVKIGFQQLTLPTKDLLPFDFLEYDTKTICNVLGWSTLLLNNDSASTYDNYQQARKQVVTDNIMPDLELFSRAWNSQILPKFKGYEKAEIFFDALQLPEMQQDTEKLVGWLTGLLDRAVISRNEFRIAIGYGTLEMPEMELYTTASPNVIPLADAVAVEPPAIEEGETIEAEIVEDDEDDEDEKRLKRLRAIIKKKRLLLNKFDPNQPRDNIGRWTDTGAGAPGSAKDLEEKYPDLTIDLYQNDRTETLELSRVIVPEDQRGQGIGTAFMEDLTTLADDKGYKIILTPSGDFGGDVDRLYEFYKRFGFIINEGENRDFSHRERMYRLPNEGKAKAGFDPNQPRDWRGRWTDTGAGGPESKECFKKWFGESKAVDEDGNPQTYYHGTTHDFDEFSRERANPENDFGRGFYFSNSLDDVEGNYEGEGADLTNRIDSLAEQLMAQDEIPEDQAYAEARQRLRGNSDRVIPVYLSLQNPLILDFDGSETDFYSVFNPNTEEPDGPLVQFIEGLSTAAAGYYDVDLDQLTSDVYEAGYGGDVGATNLIGAMRRSEGLMYATTEDGKLAGNEIIRRAIQMAGFDGIIDKNVYNKFGPKREYGRPMPGIYPDTQHVIAFEPEQIKHVDADSFCSDKNIYKSIPIAEARKREISKRISRKLNGDN